MTDDDQANGDRADDQDDNRLVLSFEHVQRLDGSRYLKIQTENTQVIVAVHGDDLDALRECLDEPPTVL